MRNDEVWDLPVGWNAAPLDRLVDIQSGFACSKKNLVPASIGVAHLRPFNVRTDGRVDLSEVYYIPPDFKDNVEDYALEPGNVLFNNTNSVELVGKTALVTEPMPCAFSNHIYRLAVKEKARGQLEPAWLALALRQLWATGYFAEQCNRWIGQAGFNATKLKELAIPIPPLDEQQRIVARIEELSERMEEARRLRVAAEENAERLLRAALADSFESLRGKHYHVEKLGDLASEMRNGMSKRIWVEPPHGVASLNIGNITQFDFSIDSCRRVRFDPERHSRYLTQGGDLLVCNVNGSPRLVGAVAVYPGASEPVVIDHNITRLRLKPSVVPEFVAYHLREATTRVEIEARFATSSGQSYLPQKKLSTLPVLVPPLSEQRRIVDYLDGVQTQVAELERLQAGAAVELDQLSEAVLAQAFQGQL